MQPETREVYNYIEGWWGDALTKSLAAKISASPWEQIVQFAEGWPDLNRLYRSAHLEALGTAELRPVFGKRATEAEKSVALRLLLYSRSVAVDADMLDPLWPILGGLQTESEASRTAIRTLFGWLASSRPLAERGDLLYTGKARGTHPSLAGGYWRAVRDRTSREDWQASAFHDLDPVLLRESAAELGGNIALATEGAGTLLALNRVEEGAYYALMDDRPLGDQRLTHLSLLSRVSVPDFRGDADLLVRLRERSDAFHEFRSGLARALDTIHGMPEDDAAVKWASEVLASELEASMPGVMKEASASPALSALRSGARALGFTAVGSVVGTGVMAVTGSPLAGAVAGLAGGVGTKAAEAVATYIDGLQARRASRAVRDVILSFRSAR